jgi:hypothetical protein
MAGTSETPEDSPASPDDINSRLAEIAAELASEARFKEPSAAERARARVTAVRPPAKLKRSGPLGRWRARRARLKAEELRAPLRPAGAPPPPPPPPRPSRLARRAAARAPVPDRGYADAEMPSRLRSGTTIVIIMVLLIGVSIGLRYLIRHYANAPAHPARQDSTTQVRSITPTASPSPSAAAAASFNPADPFGGSPAAFYLNGASGIIPPTASKVGQFPATEVAAAFTTTRKLLIAGYLDQPTLTAHRPTAFANLLATSERTWFLRNLNQMGVLPSGAQRSSRAWVTSFAPGTTLLVGGIIKVHGQMTATTARDRGRTVLRIHADYLFVYPVEPRGAAAAAGMRIVTRVYMNVDFAPWNQPASSQLVPYVQSIRGGPAGSQCSQQDGYVHPAFALSPGPSLQPAGQPVNPYDQSIPPPPAGECVPTTGT